MRTIFAILFAVIFNTNLAFAATAEEMQKMVNMATDYNIPAILRKQEFYKGIHVGETAVFLCHGQRITLFYSGDLEGKPNSAMLSFWVRKEGTFGGDTMDTFTDDKVDGSVDLGIDGANERRFVPMTSYPEGEEHRSFWQHQLDATVATLLRCHQ